MRAITYLKEYLKLCKSLFVCLFWNFFLSLIDLQFRLYSASLIIFTKLFIRFVAFVASRL